MNVAVKLPVNTLVQQASQRIAPNWPLDKLIAVNPWWQLRQQSMHEVAANLSWLGGVQVYGDVVHFQATADRFLAKALAELKLDQTVEQFKLKVLEQPQSWQSVAQLADSQRDPERQISWNDEVVHQLSQFSADYFVSHAEHARGEGCEDFYSVWLDTVCHDHGLEILMKSKGLVEHFKGLPQDSEQLIEQALAVLNVHESMQVDYLHALLLSINGWASYAAYVGWQATLNGGANSVVTQLLAARLAWELVLWQQESSSGLSLNWKRQLASAAQLKAEHQHYVDMLQVWHLANEKQIQHGLNSQLHKPLPAPTKVDLALQAVFCIDTRSEVMRRALEAQSAAIQTKGFAGFFGLPIAYAVGSYQRPQLPGLLAPQLEVREADSGQLAQAKQSAQWQQFAKSSTGGFSLVESTGMLYLGGLVKNTLGLGKDKPTEYGPLTVSSQGQALSVAEQAEMAAGVLASMGFTNEFAETVLLLGHGSQCQNNPHEAGLDCGACGGQTGEVNVRLLCQILNDAQVRAELTKQGVQLPDSTTFVPGLHNTTTDEVMVLGEQVTDQVESWLAAATKAASSERALLSKNNDAKQSAAQKARDWSQTRPEWGLANNACFIVADRARSKHLNFAGRSFLHDYNWHNDKEFGLLTAILTAPMLVTNWINMQYNASVTDPEKYGAGNKTLHNVVGGNIGVFEGNGGDLRIGLPLQSVHDGHKFMHTPTRLNVYVAAPKQAIRDIIDAHDNVRWLVDNDWLYLHQLRDDGICRYHKGYWQPVE